MKLKCVNRPTKFKNLTRDKEYDAILEGDNYVVTNDIGLRAKYAARYFAIIPTEVPLLTAVSSLSFARDGNEVMIACNDIEESIVIHNATNSCGIYEASGLGGIMNFVDDVYDHLDENVVGTRAQLFTHILISLLGYIRENYPLAFITFTDNLNHPQEEAEYMNIMNTIAVTFAEGVNRNSGNAIRLWIFN
jgi:hypothetical protein